MTPSQDKQMELNLNLGTEYMRLAGDLINDDITPMSVIAKQQSLSMLESYASGYNASKVMFMIDPEKCELSHNYQS